MGPATCYTHRRKTASIGEYFFLSSQGRNLILWNNICFLILGGIINNFHFLGQRFGSVSPESDGVMDENMMDPPVVDDDGNMGRGRYKVTGKKLVSQQFRALLVKRFHHARLVMRAYVCGNTK